MTFKHVLVEYKVKENMMFYSLDLDPMTMVLKLDLDMVKMYLHTKTEVPCYSSSKFIT